LSLLRLVDDDWIELSEIEVDMFEEMYEIGRSDLGVFLRKVV